ncbi:unnamed protein product, partial [Vitis vinifera]
MFFRGSGKKRKKGAGQRRSSLLGSKIFQLLLEVLFKTRKSLDIFFNDSTENDFLLTDSQITQDAIQVTYDVSGNPITNLSGQALYKRPFKLWSESKGTASFNTTFVLRITPRTDPGGEGLVFILTGRATRPENSEGKWLGIVNASTNGSAQNQIVAVEFDTRKSYMEDLSNNHIGVNVNSVYSIKQANLSINLSSGTDITVKIQYDGKNLSAFVGTQMKAPAIALPINLSDHLPQNVFVGFSASTGNHTQLNCVRSWEFSGSSNPITLNWETRYGIICGVAQALDYLHNGCEKRVLHRDIKASNIMLDSDFNARLGDFGLARIIQLNDQTHHSTKEIAGTPGYMAPESFHTGRAAVETDVYAFGVLVLEVVCGRKPGDQSVNNKYNNGIVDWVWEYYRRQRILDVVDLRLNGLFFSSLRLCIQLINSMLGTSHFTYFSPVVFESLLLALLLVGSFSPVKCFYFNYPLFNDSTENDFQLMRSEIAVDAIHVSGSPIPNLSGQALYAIQANPITLNWETRYGIICGVAQALDYLHNGCEKRVLHRDIKASNIMLDSDFNARLGDFGLARTIQLSDQTHHSTKEIAGTPRYMAPESFHTGRAAVETDVYAFGVLVLEVVCGRKPGDQSVNNKYNGIVDWVWEYYRRQRILDVVDLRLNGVSHKEQTEYALMLALSCCHPNPYQRPSMRIALRVLTGEVDPPVIPIEKPPFVWPATPPVSFREDLEYPPTGGLLSPPSELIGR